MFELVVHALLCCDRIITENNGKKGLIGVFHSFQFPRLPAASASWFIYAALGSMARGTHEFAVNVSHSQSSDEVLSRAGEIRVKPEREDVELVLPAACKFQHYGAHVITLEISGELVASRILRVIPTVTGTRSANGNGTGS